MFSREEEYCKPGVSKLVLSTTPVIVGRFDGLPCTYQSTWYCVNQSHQHKGVKDKLAGSPGENGGG